MDDLFQQLNWIDWAIVVLVAGATLSGIRTGFVLGSLDLIGVGVSFGAAALGYRPLADRAAELVDAPQSLLFLGSFLGILMAVQFVFGTVTRLLVGVMRPVWSIVWPLGIGDRVLGVLPGAVKGVLIATLMLLPFAMLPLLPPVSADIERSSVGSRLVSRAIDLAPTVEDLVGQELIANLTFLAPPQTDEGLRLDFGLSGQLEPDPEAEEQMLALVNRERANAGLPPLEMDDQIREVARRHSREMFELSYFSHQSEVSGTPADRLRRGGVRFGVAGENLAYAPNVAIAHEGLMNSPGHRANILSPDFRRIGIGVIRSQLRGRMFTQNFAD